jgi:hypothetical protein
MCLLCMHCLAGPHVALGHYSQWRRRLASSMCSHDMPTLAVPGVGRRQSILAVQKLQWLRAEVDCSTPDPGVLYVVGVLYGGTNSGLWVGC